MDGLGRVVHEMGIVKFRCTGLLHRTSGPAIIFPDGEIQYRVGHQKHRFNGPAVIYPDGFKMYYVYGNHRDSVEYFVKYGVV